MCSQWHKYLIAFCLFVFGSVFLEMGTISPLFFYLIAINQAMMTTAKQQHAIVWQGFVA